MSGTLLDLAKLQIDERHRESDERAQSNEARKHNVPQKPTTLIRRLTRQLPKAA